MSVPMVLLLATIAWAVPAPAEDGRRLPLPWRPDGSVPATGPGVSPAGGPAPASAAGTPLGLGDITQAAMSPFRIDGTSDLADLEAVLKAINQQVNARIALDPDRAHEGDLAKREEPLAADGWRLWVFWAADVPACAGIASSLVQVRAASDVQIRPVHLCGLRHWEEWLFHMNDYRERLLAAARAQDQAGCNAVSAAWKAEVTPLHEMLRGFYHAGIHVMCDTRAATALRVESVPCFRLVSPDHRVHALDGFTPGLDLVGWIRSCREHDAGRGRAP